MKTAMYPKRNNKHKKESNNMSKRRIFLVMAMTMVVAISGAAKVYAQNELEGRLVGTVIANNGKTIYLTERLNYGIYSIAAFTKSNGNYVEEKAFKVRKNYQSVINSVKYDEWISSNPEGGFFAFNKADNTLYVPLINEDMIGSDRYIVYQFDGQHFVRKGRLLASFQFAFIRLSICHRSY